MKYQVLLVDDEKIYLDYLQKMINWESMDCEICGCAQNGEEAIQMVEEKTPDIVFMDINMSQMDGLDACEVLQDRKSSVKVIIMTAYNEFSFAHRAIRLNVFDYLLKPFDEEELSKALKKCIAEIRKERNYEKNQEETFLKGLLDSGMPGKEREQMEQMISNYHFLAVLFGRKTEVPFSERERIRSLLSDYFYPMGIESYFLGNQKGYGIVIHAMMQEQIPLAAIKSRYKKLLADHPEEEFQWVAIGNVVDGIDNLQNTYQNAQLVRENRIRTTGKICGYDDIQQLDKDVTFFNSSDVSLLIKAFEMKEYDTADSIIEKMFGLSQNKMLSFQYVIAAYYSLVTGIYSYYHYKEDNDLTQLMGNQNNLITEIGLCSDVHQILEIVRNYVYEVFSDCINVRVGNKKELLVAKIEKYLQDHYTEKSLSVHQIADEFFFENSYIRRVYKLQTHKTIIQRLEEIRMEKAKQLLMEKHYKNSDIAEMTGYCDQYYFSKRFKLYYGCSPSEFQMEK